MDIEHFLTLDVGVKTLCCLQKEKHNIFGKNVINFLLKFVSLKILIQNILVLVQLY